jgi:hypothetical protein
MAEKFELRRSSRAEISQAVAAIDNDRPRLVENALRVAQQLGKRQMDRAFDRGDPMLVVRKHIDDLPTCGHEPQHFAMIDNPHLGNLT